MGALDDVATEPVLGHQGIELLLLLLLLLLREECQPLGFESGDAPSECFAFGDKLPRVGVLTSDWQILPLLIAGLSPRDE